MRRTEGSGDGDSLPPDPPTENTTADTS
jgi:hypothetical protein